jgi:hypothetical protein
MPLNLYTFYSYSLSERINLLQKQGEYLTHIRDNNCFVDLYSVDKYLVEVRHNMNLFNIQSIDLIDPKDERLNLYATKVNLSDLYAA